MDDFYNSNEQFWIEHENIRSKLENLVKGIREGKLRSKRLFQQFPGAESSSLAIGAIVKFFENPTLYSEVGGNVLLPDNRIPYTEAHLLIQVIIKLNLEYGGLSAKYKRRFHKVVIEHSTTGPGVWDFHQAETPFLDLLSIHPKRGSNLFRRRIKHLHKVLRWSAPSKLGYCWSTWKLFQKRIDWLRRIEISALVSMVAKESEDGVDDDDKRWMKAILKSKRISKRQKKRIEQLISSKKK